MGRNFTDEQSKEIEDLVKSYNREEKINELLFTEGSVVLLPFDEEGVIVEVDRTKINFFPYKVRVIKTSGLFNQMGDIQEFKADNLELK